jgi:hypothetical protein
MNLSQWLAFCKESGISSTRNADRGATVGDLQTVFVAVNFEEEGDSAEAQANDDGAMMRFEFLEGLVRAAFGKLIASKKCTDASDAVQMLLQDIVLPAQPPASLHDPNEFRRV